MVVKQFPPRPPARPAAALAQGLERRAQLSRRARALGAAGVPTPEPLSAASDSTARAGRRATTSAPPLAGGVEPRYFLRARNAGREAREFPDVDRGGCSTRSAAQARAGSTTPASGTAT